MRRFSTLSVLCLAAGILSACDRDQVHITEDIPTAGVRFINAVPDSAGALGLNFHFVDLVESNFQFRISYRNSPPSSGVQVSTAIEYKNARAGSRHFKVFLDDTLQAAAMTVLADSTVTLEANHNYTFLLWGKARSTGSDKMHLTVIDETVPDPGAQVALRVINATGAPIDARQYAKGGTVPAGATWANVPAYGISSYVTAPPGLVMYNVRAAGSATDMFADLQAPPGDTTKTSAPPNGKKDIDAVPGTIVAGSAVTMIIFPPSVEGSKAPQGNAFAETTGTFMWDRRPPRIPGV